MNCSRVSAVLATTALVLGLSGVAAADPPEFRARAGLVMSGFGIFGSSSGGISGSAIDAGGFGNAGFALGVGARVPLGGRLSLQGEAMYVRKAGTMGFTFQPDFLPPNFGLTGINIQVSIDYIEFPVTLRYDLHVDHVRPYFFGGAALAAKLGASTDLVTRDLLDRLDVGAIDDLVHSTDVTIVLGAGVDFTNSPWSAELRASLGLQGVFESTAGGQELDSSTKTRAFMLLVGYRF